MYHLLNVYFLKGFMYIKDLVAGFYNIYFILF